jgi:hypothetical protein
MTGNAVPDPCRRQESELEVTEARERRLISDVEGRPPSGTSAFDIHHSIFDIFASPLLPPLTPVPDPAA